MNIDAQRLLELNLSLQGHLLETTAERDQARARFLEETAKLNARIEELEAAAKEPESDA